MADTSPGKVQALRAIFSEKNNPVMGLMPPGTKLPPKPCRPLNGSVQDTTNTSPKDETFGDCRSGNKETFGELRLGNKVLPMRGKSPSSFAGDCGDKPTLRPSAPKPLVGPKPPHLVQQKLATSTTDTPKTVIDTSSEAKSKAFAETIASFMFSNNKENEGSPTTSSSVNRDNKIYKDSNINKDKNSTQPPLPPSAPKPRISQLLSQNNTKAAESDSRCCSFISSDNYVCKVRRKELPSKEKLGPAPLKPIKPHHLKLPSSLCSTPTPESAVPPALQRPSYPCPPRPVTSPPLPPPSVPVIKPLLPSSLREEIEELYEDTLLGENKRPVSLIPEYTAEEEEAELYNDADVGSEESFSDSSLKKKKPPPPIPSEYLQPNVNGSVEELYQDADGTIQEEFYEIMPCDEAPEDSSSPLYSNNKREIEKLKKEEEKRNRREQKEKEKREKELEKLKKKFGLTGEEIPIDDGLVKWDSRGSKNGDLPVKKGETVLILRMENNPSGRWLVKNEKGKIGYVELTNIEVDPLSVKSVMSIRRLSMISAGEELYCEAKSEEEAIYEVTY